jgi:hypothetical protein
MKAKSFSKSKDWKETWLQTALSIVALAFTVLVGFGVITGAQGAEALPIVNSTLGAVSTIIASVVALVGIFGKQEPPVV